MKRTLLERITLLEKAIYEAKQVGIIYHIIDVSTFAKYVVPTDEIIGSKASKQFTNSLYRKSETSIYFTRDKKFNIKALLGEKGFVLQLVIDGDKLSERYKLVPYNDLAFYDEESDEPGWSDYAVKNRGSEVIALKPIKNVSKYIKEIRLIASDAIMPEIGEHTATTIPTDITNELVKELKKYDRRAGSKLFMYLDRISEYAYENHIKIDDNFRRVLLAIESLADDSFDD